VAKFIVVVEPGRLESVLNALRAMGVRVVKVVQPYYILVEAPQEMKQALEAVQGVSYVWAERVYRIALPVEAKLREFIRRGGPFNPAAMLWAASFRKDRWPTSISRRVLGADVADKMGVTGRGVKVAVVDTGFDATPQKLRVDFVYSTMELQPVGLDDNGHGVHIITTIAGSRYPTPWGWLEGVAKGVSVGAFKTLGYGLGFGSTMDVMEAIIAAYSWGAKIINLSLGSDIAPGESHDVERCPLCSLVTMLAGRGVLVVVASGNSGVGYSSCLSKDTYISTFEGPKRICEVKPGDLVYSLDNGRIVLKPVLAVIPRGVRKVYKLKTGNHTIRATDDHLFLVLKGGRLTWLPLSKINVGDYVIVPYGFHMGEGEPPTDIPKLRGTRVAVEVKNKLAFMRLLGYLLGDGYISTSRGRYRVILCCRKPHMREKLRRLIEQAFEFIPLNKRNTQAVHEYHVGFDITSRNLVEFLVKLGFNKHSREREIPDWVFTLRKEYIFEFIGGLLDAEGYTMLKKGDKRVGVEMSSEKLVRKLKFLAQQVGIPSSNVRTRKTRPRVFPSGRYHPGGDNTYVLELYSLPEVLVELGLIEADIPIHPVFNSQYLRLEEVVSIEPDGEDEVYDITVEGSHNFIAEGIIVHNCPAVSPGAVTVGALNKDLTATDFTSRRHQLYESAGKPEVSAPGAHIGSSTTGLIDVMEWIDGPRVGYVSGTSMATPHVSALLALWVEYARARGVELDREAVMDIIRGGAEAEGRSWSPDTGYGPPRFEWVIEYLRR